jgi:hypothetical protein
MHLRGDVEESDMNSAQDERIVYIVHPNCDLEGGVNI